MLVLTRKSGEGIRIGDDVRIVVVGLDDNQVRLGIEAPQELSVHRDEVYDRIKDENIKASMIRVDVLKRVKEIWKKGDSEG